jgi:4-hydroxybenzoate polyprenyltransferase
MTQQEYVSSMIERWWTYQRERFPVATIGVFALVVGLSAVCYSYQLRGQSSFPRALPVLVATSTSLLFFLQLRIADEFKDFEEDARYRPYRPVPRGLVSLRELGLLGVASALAQLGLALLLRPEMVLVLGLVWVYMALMTKEFFVGTWLKARPIAYMLSHMLIIPLVNLYATACDWSAAAEGPPAGLQWFLIASYFTGLVLELGRKIRSPIDEEPGVETYSFLWGGRRAVLAWLAALVGSAIAVASAARRIDFLLPVVALLAIMLTGAAWAASDFLRNSTTRASKRIEAQSGVWTLSVYLGLGVAPLLWRWWIPSSAVSL